MTSPLYNLFAGSAKKPAQPAQNVFSSTGSSPNQVTEYPQPSVSPYAGPINRITIGSTTYFIPDYYVSKIPTLKFPHVTEFSLQEMYADIGHTFIHYLYTGEYQTLAEPFILPLQKARVREFKRSLYAFHLAQTHQIMGLLDHAKRYMQTFVTSVTTLELLQFSREIYASLLTGRKWFEWFLQDQLTAAFGASEARFREDVLKYGVGSDARFDQFILELVMKIYSGSMAKLTKATPNVSAARRDTPNFDEDASTDQTTLVADSNDTKSDPEASLDGSDNSVKDSKSSDAVPEQQDAKPPSPSPRSASPLPFVFRCPQPVRVQMPAMEPASPKIEPASPKTEPKSEPEPEPKEASKPETAPKPIPEKAAQQEEAPVDKPESNLKTTPRRGAQTPEHHASGYHSSPQKKSKKKKKGGNKSGNSNTPSKPYDGGPKKWEQKTAPVSFPFA
ncbi:hypothetical protein AbraIFM66951_001358 [Aspergillus brasiliensis]|uniref:BTB domain-containing protein n=1 Tax=Aspergillus brasiliensis TaxID=319629 RepID=A0A9W5Z0N6_9EURO|nr:hypothetical protein AbraCBS73388_001228 [Aspergillus brasiliensis]GKZ49101.1 hypothetical protein AbraIFM66951_001358 [Aspergillus brasiliensis]